MKNEFVVFKDGRIMRLDEVAQVVSADLYQNEEHYFTCEHLADQFELSPELRRVLVNLISLKSARARIITALYWYIHQENFHVKEVHAYSDICRILEVTCPTRVVFRCIGSVTIPLITRRQALQVLFKVVLHRLYRVFRRVPKSGMELLRAWVDVTEAMYPQLVNSAEVRIYPFPFGATRQFKFIHRCSKLGASWSLDGLPYSVIDALRALFCSVNREIIIAGLEHNTYIMYADEVLSWKPTGIYTSDEYEVGAVSLYEKLADHNIASVNTAHGIGWYCPYVVYSEFRAFNVRQGDFYRKRSDSLLVTFRKQQNVILPLTHASCRLAPQAAFVLVHQNFDDFNMPAERDAQQRLAKLIHTASEAVTTPYFIKLHPNTLPSKVSTVAKSLGGKPLTGWDTLAEYRPIFILINSTAFFELRDIAPILVFTAPSFEPELYFETGFHTVNEENCVSTLTKLLDVNFWEQTYNSQRSPRYVGPMGDPTALPEMLLTETEGL